MLPFNFLANNLIGRVTLEKGDILVYC